MSEKTIFKRIIDGEIPTEFVYEDEFCLAFHDIQPQAPVHVLVIPRKEVVNIASLGQEDELLAGRLLMAAQRVAGKLNLENGYRIVVNCGPDGGQTVDHLHLHVLGGRKLNWPPG